MTLKVKSSHRPNRRYLLFEAESMEKVLECLKENLGVLGMSKVSPIVVSKKPLVLAVLSDSVLEIRAACELSKEKILVKRVSGTLKGLHRNL